MTELLTAAQMRAIEQAAIDRGDVTGLELMERAGRGVVEAILAEWPELAEGGDCGALSAPVGSRTDVAPPGAPGYLGLNDGEATKGTWHAVVLCGPGNNGGDGFVIARLLVERGWAVEVFLYGDAGKLPLDARVNYERWVGMGKVMALTPDSAAAGVRPALLVDALFGIGLTRPLSMDLVRARHAVEKRPRGAAAGDFRCRTVAVDCVSGMDGDSGEILAPPAPADEDFEAQRLWLEEDAARWFMADLTVTFHQPKVGHYMERPLSRAIRVVDIGLPAAFGREPGAIMAARRHPGQVALILPAFRKPGAAGRIWLSTGGGGQHAENKFQRGHLLVLAGGSGRGGAARLAARGALRIGAGLVTVGCPPEALIENAARLDAVMLRPVADAAALAVVLEDARISALCLGPGLGLDRARDLVPVALTSGRRVVLDADALTAFRDDSDRLFSLCHAAAEGGDEFGDRAIVMTPHEGEFARLFPDLAEREREARRLSKLDAARQAARRAGAIMVLKGAATVIARPDGTASVHPALYERRAPQLATAGAGDVLAGFIAGLLASPDPVEPIRRVELAAWLHVECARAFGPGLIAEDLPEVLPRVLAGLVAE